MNKSKRASSILTRDRSVSAVEPVSIAGFAYLQFQQQRSSHDVLISNQVAKGFELLDNKDNQIQQRLGGIYALKGVMNDSEQSYQPVVETLNAFVRDGTKTVTGDGPPAADIQAALTVIGRRKEGVGTEKPVDLINAHIPKADLAGAHLTGAKLSGADLSDAALSGATVSREQLEKACGTTSKFDLDLTLKPCPAFPPAK